jgi:light-regulated signal transduction histidine kinase (bacteriophytochrome)
LSPGQEPPDWQARCAELEARLERLESFAATATHDLQEPLRMVTSYLSLLERREGARLTENGRSYLHSALDGAGRMKELVNGLFAYSTSGRRAPGPPAALSVVLSDVLRDLEVAIAEAGAEVRAGELEPVTLGALEGRIVLSNLVSNALRYRGVQPPQIVISSRGEADGMVVTVADNGPGVAAETAQTMFEPFTRGQQDGHARSAGLGLATCSRIVKGWGGRIWWEPREGGGSLFRFTVPLPAAGKD